MGSRFPESGSDYRQSGAHPSYKIWNGREPPLKDFRSSLPVLTGTQTQDEISAAGSSRFRPRTRSQSPARLHASAFSLREHHDNPARSPVGSSNAHDRLVVLLRGTGDKSGACFREDFRGRLKRAFKRWRELIGGIICPGSTR